uniref:Vacuole membrane protein 1 n=1 Tax=Mastacembelus armatus TaxID=205130 RepID=A0A7N9ARU1_9TELE
SFTLSLFLPSPLRTPLLVFLTLCACVSYVRNMGKATLWCACWVGLGILFSVGLSIGLHTFFLYLVRCRVSQGPHYECGLVDFPKPTLSGPNNLPGLQGSISLWTIISKVRLEACMWVSACYTLAVHHYTPVTPACYNGLAARLSGTDPDDKDTQKSEEMLYGSQSAQVTHCSLHWNDQGLLSCSHIPRITWTFSDSVLDIFGATLIRKAVIKMHIQVSCC